MLLYPDQRADQPENDTVCFGAPIHKCDWEFLLGRTRGQKITQTQMPFTIIVDETASGSNDGNPNVFDSVYFMRNDSEVNDKVCVILRDNEDPDICLESAAWIRIQENFPGMIYIVKAGSVHTDKWEAHSSAIGADQECVCMIDFVTLTDEDS